MPLVTSIKSRAFLLSERIDSWWMSESGSMSAIVSSVTSPLDIFYIPPLVRYIQDGAFESNSFVEFYVDSDNQYYQSVDGVLFNKGMTDLISVPGSKEGPYVIPDSVTSIWSYSFYECKFITSVEIPNSVTYIGGMAFYYCTSLTSIIIPDSVTYIGSQAFYGSNSLEMVSFGTGLTTMYYGPFTVTFKDAYGNTLSQTIENLAGHVFEGSDGVLTIVS